MTLAVVWWLAILVGVALVGQAVGLLSGRTPRAAGGRRLLVFALLLVAALQPRVGPATEPLPAAGPEIILLVDRTTSMGALDHQGGQPRMAGVAEDIERIVAQAPTARFTVVCFDNDARVVVPATTDTSAVVSMAQTMGWREETFGTGSDIAVAGPLAESLLREGQAERPGAQRFLVYFGDGEQTARTEPGSFAPLAELLDGALVLGYGTQTGGQMLVRPGDDQLVTRNQVAQISRINQPNLERLADQLGGRYEHRTGDQELVLWPGSTGVQPLPTPDEPGFALSGLAGLAAVALLAVDWWGAVRAVRRARQEAR